MVASFSQTILSEKCSTYGRAKADLSRGAGSECSRTPGFRDCEFHRKFTDRCPRFVAQICKSALRRTRLPDYARAVDKVGQLQRSAGFQPAVSPISNWQRVASKLASDISARPQAGSPAIQQVWKPALRLCPQPYRL